MPDGSSSDDLGGACRSVKRVRIIFKGAWVLTQMHFLAQGPTAISIQYTRADFFSHSFVGVILELLYRLHIYLCVNTTFLLHSGGRFVLIWKWGLEYLTRSLLNNRQKLQQVAKIVIARFQKAIKIQFADSLRERWGPQCICLLLLAWYCWASLPLRNRSEFSHSVMDSIEIAMR